MTDLTWNAEFSACFDRCGSDMRFTAYLLCGDWHEAEDLMQAAFLKLFLAGPRPARREGLEPYLRRIVVRSFLAERRRGRWSGERVTDMPPDGIGEDQLALWQALSMLAPRQRAVLVLRYWNDLSVEETAVALACSTGTVKSQENRGLAALRRTLAAAVANLPVEV